MKRHKSPTPPAGNLRAQAVERLKEKGLPDADDLSRTDDRALVHELQVHQIELEMQNEELRRAQAQAENALQAAHHGLERRVEERTAELERSNVRLAHEIKERKQTEEDVAEQLRFETLLADPSARFVNVPAGEVVSRHPFIPTIGISFSGALIGPCGRVNP